MVAVGSSYFLADSEISSYLKKRVLQKGALLHIEKQLQITLDVEVEKIINGAEKKNMQNPRQPQLRHFFGAPLGNAINDICLVAQKVVQVVSRCNRLRRPLLLPNIS